MDLQADSVQGVLFLIPGQQQEDALKLWAHLFKDDGPDGFQRAGASPSLGSNAWGERWGYRVGISAQVGRIDLFLNQPPAVNVGVVSGPSRIIDVPTAAKRLSKIMKELTEHLKVVRLGLVLDLAKAVDRGSEGVELRRLLPEFPFPLNSTDIVLQFNSRRAFVAAPDIEMNRLCVWTMGQAGFMPNLFASGPNLFAQGPSMVVLSPFLSVKVDVNTAPEMHPSADCIQPMIDEMLRECLKISHEGMGAFV
jgi:hypothetical protein